MEDLNPFNVTKPAPIREPVVVFPGSFNPLHEGHLDVIDKALKAFNKVVVLQTNSTEKGEPTPILESIEKYAGLKWRLMAEIERGRVVLRSKRGFLADSIQAIADEDDFNIVGVIRGLRNGYDLQTEMVQQYWYEDLKMTLPIFYIITDRKHAHISSSAIRAVERLAQEKQTQEANKNGVVQQQ